MTQPAPFPGLFVSGGSGGGGGAGPSQLTSRAAWLNTAFFVDPANSSGLASDSNNGLTITTPIRTTAKLNQLLFMHDVQVTATITYMSDDASGTLLDLSTVSAGLGAPGSLSFVGTPVILRTGHTFSAVQTINPATNTRQTVTDGAFSFAPLIGNVIVDKTGANTDSSAWIVSGTTSPSCSRPITSAAVAGAFSPGDSYVVQRGSQLSLAPNPPFIGSLSFQDFSIQVATGGPAGTLEVNVFPIYNRCSFNGELTFGGTFLNCYLGSGDGSILNFALIGGVLITTALDLVLVGLAVTGDTYVTGYGFIVGPYNYAQFLVANTLGSGVQFQDCTGPAGLIVAGDMQVGGLIWGSGNSGVGLQVQAATKAQVPAGAALRPIVTGAGGDFGFQALNSGATVKNARPWNEAGGVAGAAATTSWVNFAGAAFNFQAHDFSTGASLVGV